MAGSRKKKRVIELYKRLIFVVEKNKNKNGNKYDFPQSTAFEIGLLEGCSTGKILSPDGQLEEYFESVQAPLRFVVSDNPDEADTLVKLRVGVPNSIDTVYQTYSYTLFQPNSNPQKGSHEDLNLLTSNVLEAEFCIALFNNPGHGVAEGKIEDKCKEPIVECTVFEPQEINEESDEFKILKKNSRWEWQDENGNNKVIYLDDYYCIYHHKSSGGLTKVLSSTIISMATDTFFTTSDIVINACLIRDDEVKRNRWSFNLENIRIPIFSDLCGIPPERDLKNSLSTDIWKEKIHSYKDYMNVIDGLDYLIVGTYSQFDEYPGNYVFSDGIMEHESEHVRQVKKYITTYINQRFVEINELEVLQENYKCPEDAINIYEKKLKLKIWLAITRGSLVKSLMGTTKIYPPPNSNARPKSVPNCELAADKAQRETYKNIKIKFNEWAESQTWWPIKQ